MTPIEAIGSMLDALGSQGVPYVLVGSLASNFYGVPRATADADFVVAIEGAAVARLREALGGRLRMEPQSSFETITATRRYVFLASDGGFSVELFLLSNDEYDQERFRRRRSVAMFGRMVAILSAEDVIVTKLRWASHGARRKDLDDLRGVLALQRNAVDWDYVRLWCGRQGTATLLHELLRALPQL